MSVSVRLLAVIKRRLKAQGLTYRTLARELGVSEPTVKRHLSGGRFSLDRFDRICEVLGLDASALLAELESETAPITRLDERQEQAIAADPMLFLVTYLVVNDWDYDGILASFDLEENELVRRLLALDAMGIVEFAPPRRLRRLTARNFQWRTDGPVHAFFVSQLTREFFAGRFDDAGDELLFLGGRLSAESRMQLAGSLRRLASEFDLLARRDSRLPADEREGCGAVLAVRRWEYSQFAKRRRDRTAG